MDANIMELESEKEKLLKEQCMDDEKHTIGKLPDTLIHDILSLLPTEEAVATSILSTRWKWMWTSLSKLEFDEGTTCKDPMDKVKFANYVDGVLNHHNKTFLRKFLLVCKNHDASRVTAWISAALQPKVEEVNLNVHVEGSAAFIVLPELVCNSESLRVLKLQSNNHMVIPTSICLPNLKILHLHSVVYSPTLSGQPLSNCPTLSELILDECKMPDSGTIIISVPTVKTLRLCECDTHRDSDMKIYAENLISFYYIGGMPNGLSLYNTSSLVDAYVEVTRQSRGEIGPLLEVLLRQLSNVKFLALSNLTIWCLCSYPLSDGKPPTFHNLIHLELGARGCLCHVKRILALMENSPNLEHLLLQKEICPKKDIATESSRVPVVPGIFLSRLMSVKFKDFRASKMELTLMKILLERAIALEKVTILSSKEHLQDGGRRAEVEHRLFKIRRASNYCSIDYS